MANHSIVTHIFIAYLMVLYLLAGTIIINDVIQAYLAVKIQHHELHGN